MTLDEASARLHIVFSEPRIISLKSARVEIEPASPVLVPISI
jgi:hypothetical protein